VRREWFIRGKKANTIEKGRWITTNHEGIEAFHARRAQKYDRLL
jgi:hypothetical protein